MIVDDGNIFAQPAARPPMNRLRKSLKPVPPRRLSSYEERAKLPAGGLSGGLPMVRVVASPTVLRSTAGLSLDYLLHAPAAYTPPSRAAAPGNGGGLAPPGRSKSMGVLTGLEDLPDPDETDDFHDPSLSPYAIRAASKGGVRNVATKTREIIHSAVYHERETGIGAWLRALDAESRKALEPLAHVSFEAAMDDLAARPLSSSDAGDGMPASVRAVERWLVSNGALPEHRRSSVGLGGRSGGRGSAVSFSKGASAAGESAARGGGGGAPWSDEEDQAGDGQDDDDAEEVDPTLGLDARLQPRTRKFATEHFELSVRGRTTLTALGRELTSGLKQAEFAQAVLNIRRNRFNALGGGAGGGKEPESKGRALVPQQQGGQSNARDGSWEETVLRVSEFLQLDAESKRNRRGARSRPPRVASTGGEGAQAGARLGLLSAHEISALRKKLTKHRELMRRVFYAYRALDGLALQLPQGGRLPPSLGGPIEAELHGLPPLLTLDPTPFVTKGGGYATRLGEAQDPPELRIALAQLWRLLKDVHVLGTGLTSAEVAAFWHEAGTLYNAETIARETGARTTLGSSPGQSEQSLPVPGTHQLEGLPIPMVDPMGGFEISTAHYPLASTGMSGFAECLVLLAHSRYGRRTPSIAAAFDRLCVDHLEEYAAQGPGCVDAIRTQVFAAPLEALFARRAKSLERLYIFWSKAHYEGGGSRKLASAAVQGLAVDRVLGSKAVAAPVTAIGVVGEKRAAREAAAERRREVQQADTSADAEVLRQLGLSSESAVEAADSLNVGEEWQWQGDGGGDGMNFNTLLALLAEVHLLQRERRMGEEKSVSAQEAVRIFEQTIGVRGAQPRICRANADAELSFSEFLEFLARLTQLLHRGRGHAPSGQRGGGGGSVVADGLEVSRKLAGHIESLLDKVLLPPTEQRILMLTLSTTASVSKSDGSGVAPVVSGLSASLGGTSVATRRSAAGVGAQAAK